MFASFSIAPSPTSAESNTWLALAFALVTVKLGTTAAFESARGAPTPSEEHTRASAMPLSGAAAGVFVMLVEACALAYTDKVDSLLESLSAIFARSDLYISQLMLDEVDKKNVQL
jgi:hypothetical protein